VAQSEALSWHLPTVTGSTYREHNAEQVFSAQILDTGAYQISVVCSRVVGKANVWWIRNLTANMPSN
jgi:hypothetical protein